MKDGNFLRDRVNTLSKYLNVTTDAFSLKQAKNREDIASQALILLKKDNELLRSFLFNVYYERLERSFLMNFFPEKNSIGKNEAIEKLLPYECANERLKILEKETDLMLPGLVLPKLNFIIMLLLFAIPLLAVILYIVFNMGVFAAISSILKLGFFAFIIFLPYVIAKVSFPNFFVPSVFSGIETFEDFVQDSVIDNLYLYDDSNDENLKKEIFSLV
ncbi:hypothetical protein N7E81_02920 [Reichenbachiella carrageenanivorans]|uniref:Uncharacterized protein n=1 Tax=Reichenbachiella carrageenanivorans TaxID=2979869 RepID=A0ABY6D1L4_9BACT|nr:hypothetical protein [Reichenbachiella carrageenanivorans]UXX80057.1 hypothetical protein N7E81_02920 [Reichenbachiella carrageenanivorans]